MTFVITESQAKPFGDFGAAVRALSTALKHWQGVAEKQPPEKAAETLALIRNLRNAADWYVSSSIGPAPNFEPDFEIVDDIHIAEMCERIAAGAVLS
jgi:hypothetical protein